MKRWVRFALVLSLFAGTFFLVGFVKRYHVPRLEQWLLLEIEKQSTTRSPLRVWPKSVHIEFFPPSIVLKEVRLLPQKELAAMMAPAVVDEASIRINWFYLLTGRLRLAHVGATGAHLIFIVKDRLPRPNAQSMDFDFKALADLPIDELALADISLWTRLESQALAMRLSDLNLTLGKRGKSLFVQLNAPKAEVKFKGASDPMPMHLAMRAFIEEKQIHLSAFQIKAGRSFVVAAGRVEGGLKPDQWQRLDVNSRLQINLADVEQWEKILRKPTLPRLAGGVKADLSLHGSITAPQLNVTANASDLAIGQFGIGNVNFKGGWLDNQLVADEVDLVSSAGQLQLRQGRWKPQSDQDLTITVKPKNLEIGQMLENLGIHGVPVRIPTSGELHCKGPLLPTPQVTCAGQMQVHRFLVHGGKPKHKTIIELERAAAKGQVKITDKMVACEGEIQIGEKSRGTAEGTVDFAKGFQFKYRGQEVHFSDVKSLLNLDLSGRAELSGTTEGTAKTARLKMNLEGRNVVFEKYALGDVQTELTYKDGLLVFGKLLGQAGTSRYNGQISIHIPREEIQVQAKAPYVELSDVKDIFAQKVKLPFTVGGTGAVEVNASGPLAFSRLSYQLKSSFFRGQVANESFDQFTFNVSAKNGQALAEKVQLSRGNSVVDLNGQINPQGIIDTVVVGRRLRLEESENISRVGLDITGQLDLTMAIRGQLPRPNLETHGRVSHLIIGDRPSEDSTFKLKLSGDRIEGGGNFLGKVVALDFIYPLAESAPFRLWVKAEQWNFGNLFSFLSESIRQRDIQTSLSAVAKLSAEKGGPTNVSGDLEINELKVRRGSVGIKNSSTIVVGFNQGVVSAKPFLFEGEGGFLKVALNEISAQRLNASANGKLDLSLLTLLTPFLSDLQGRLALNMAFSGRPATPLISGSAYIEQGLVKFRDFPHAFTNLRSDILFSQQDIVINALRGELGGGQISGDGRIRLLGRNSVPVDVKGQFSGVALNVPEGFRTSGAGTWWMKGPYFPYTIGINYDLQAGEIVSEFSGAGGSSAVSPSALLPKFLVEETKQPIQLDLNIAIKNTLNVRNSLAQTPVRGKLRVVGPPNKPRLTGVLTPVPGGKVFFRDVGFEISNGYVEYQDDPPENPKIYLTAQAVVKETIRDERQQSVENEYEVSLLIQGRGKNPKITVSSLPALTEREIISLLALGMTSSDNRTAGASFSKEGLAIGTSILQKPLGNEMRNRLGLDVQLTQSEPTPEAAASPKVVISKQFTPKLSASAGRTLDKAPMSSMRMEYKFNRSFSVIGSWDGKEGATQVDKEKNVEQSVFGLDLEFKVNFK